jgi:hypothetical protein
MEMIRELSSRGHDVSSFPLSAEASSLCSIKAGAPERAEVVLLDVPYRGDEAVCLAHKKGAKVVALDYEGSVAPEVAISLQVRPGMPSSTRSYTGIDYAIIRREIRKAKAAKCRGSEVLVVIGGGDFEGLSDKIASRLSATPLCVIQGPAGGVIRSERENVRILRSPPDLPHLMPRCSWAVTSGGTAMLEMLFLGKATHVVPRTDAEMVFARGFLEQGALLGVGLEGLNEPSPASINRCEELGPLLVDGCGAERIAQTVELLL